MRTMGLRLLLPVLPALLAVGCGDGHTRACFGSTEFCSQVFGRNQPPRARADAPAEAAGGATVQLDGSASSDPDGRLESFSWTQQSGPTVTLVNAGRAVAQFIAPEVIDEILLEFRLVVTDDEASSDTEDVRITVLPATQAALARGIELLGTIHHPDTDGATGNPDPAHLGLWLAARARAAAAGAEPNPDRLLDEIRFLELVRAVPIAAAELAEPARRLFMLGQSEVAAFTRQRDPATAELARGLGAGTAPPSAEDWYQALNRAFPTMAGIGDSGRRADTAARRLLQAGSEHRPASFVAADVLILTTAAGPGPETDD